MLLKSKNLTTREDLRRWKNLEGRTGLRGYPNIESLTEEFKGVV